MTALPVATNRYFDTKFQRPGVKLLPNEFFVTSDDIVLATVLGSCVAACVVDPVAGIGGMNHFMLPDDGAQAFGTACASMRYGAYAMEVLLNELLKGGARRERLEAKVFGGGAVLAGMTTLNIGDRNAEFVRRYLALEQVRIVAEDLQGKHPRKVVYLPRTGQALVKKMPVIQDSPLERREQALALALSQERLRPAGEIELFAPPRRARAAAAGAQDAVPGPRRPGSVS